MILTECRRLRQVDVKAEHFERQVQRLEQERDEWERKHGEAVEKYQQSKRELDEVVMQMESLVSYTMCTLAIQLTLSLSKLHVHGIDCRISSPCMKSSNMHIMACEAVRNDCMSTMWITALMARNSSVFSKSPGHQSVKMNTKMDVQLIFQE